MTTEKRLIDLLCVDFDEMDISDCTDIEDIISAVITHLYEQPEVDAVEVVRCKDCCHGITDEEEPGMCKCVKTAEYESEIGLWVGFVEYNTPDFFCAYGERRSDT